MRTLVHLLNILIFLYFCVGGANAIASDCKVNDSDTASEYSGGCSNGLANGQGTATGKDKYTGDFLNGNKHGRGVYIWSTGARYEGSWLNDMFDGFGSFTTSPNMYLSSNLSEIGDQYPSDGKVIGLWRNHKIYKRFYGCSSKTECEQKEVREIAEENSRKKAWAAELNSKNPQAMYLKASTLMRNGDGSKATELYEAIIANHANSIWAVKASDQLDQNRRESSTRSAIDSTNREAASRAYQQCRIEVDSCYSRGGTSCYRNCDSLR
jgi:hypothetical protein